MKKVLLIVPHQLDRNPSQRFRIEQYIKFLESRGYTFEVSYLLNRKDDKIFYSKGMFFRKFLLLLKFIIIRFRDVLRMHRYDIIFVQREAIFIGTSFFEYMFSLSRAKLVYDFDDSIWLPNVSDANKNFDWLKNYNKTSDIIKLSNIVIAGNSYLADYALQFNSNVHIIPTTVDTNKFQRSLNVATREDVVCIGWSGSHTTIKYFESIINILERISLKYGNKVKFRVISNSICKSNKIEIENHIWSSANEVEQLKGIDIGLMPLPNDKWTQGKCGLKGLVFMSMEIPVIMSPVGVNNEIIKDSENGFLADSDIEWFDKLCLLIEDSALRNSLGKAGRHTVLESFSIDANKNKYLKIMDRV